MDGFRIAVWEPSNNVRLNEIILEGFNAPIVPSVVTVPTAVGVAPGRVHPGWLHWDWVKVRLTL